MPDYNAVTDNQAKYVGGKENWIALNEGTHTGGWTLVQTKSDFEAMAAGDLAAMADKHRLVAVAQVANTFAVRPFGIHGHRQTVRRSDDRHRADA